MDKIEFHEVSEVEKSINSWRQSERKIMIETVQDLIRSAHKYAKSQYTPSAQRARWTKLAGQLIWYEDQILKSFSLEALTIQFHDLEKKVVESEKRRELEILNRNYPRIGFSRPKDKKEEESEGSETSDASDASDAVETVEAETVKETISGGAG